MTEQLFLSDLILKPQASFQNFVTGKNEELIHLLTHLNAGTALFLWGETGAGKTHLLQALEGQYYTPHTFPTDLVDFLSLPPKTIITVDDIERFSPAQLHVLFQLYNEWQARKLTPQAFSLVTVGNLPPMQMSIREDLRNRLGWGLVYEVHSLSDENCQNALEQRAIQKGFNLNKDVLHWIFTHCPRDIPTLFALLEALDAYSLRLKRPITIPLLKNLIQSQELFQ